MDVYERETAEVVKLFLAQKISFPACIAALDSALENFIPKLKPEDATRLRIVMLSNNEIIMTNWSDVQPLKVRKRSQKRCNQYIAVGRGSEARFPCGSSSTLVLATQYWKGGSARSEEPGDSRPAGTRRECLIILVQYRADPRSATAYLTVNSHLKPLGPNC